MDRNYARLSLMAGYFASAADKHLGTDRFISQVRRHQWELTPERLAAWKAEAVREGVPADALEVPADKIKVFEDLVDLGIAMQANVDAATGHTKQ